MSSANKTTIIGSVIILIVVFVIGGLLAKSLLEGKTARTTISKENQLIVLINNYRVAHHLGKLKLSIGLRAAAREHSQDMLTNNYFSHAGFPQRVRRHKHASYLGENLALGTGGFGEPNGILSLWRSSPEHKKILLTARFKQVGVGLKTGTWQGQSGTTIATADFSN